MRLLLAAAVAASSFLLWSPAKAATCPASGAGFNQVILEHSCATPSTRLCFEGWKVPSRTVVVEVRRPDGAVAFTSTAGVSQNGPRIGSTCIGAVGPGQWAVEVVSGFALLRVQVTP